MEAPVIVRLPDVIKITGLSRSSVDLYEKNGMFPKRIRLGVRAIGWERDDITAWVKARKADS